MVSANVHFTESMNACKIDGSKTELLVIGFDYNLFLFPSFPIFDLFDLNPLIVASSFIVVGINHRNKRGYPYSSFLAQLNHELK